MDDESDGKIKHITQADYDMWLHQMKFSWDAEWTLETNNLSGGESSFIKMTYRNFTRSLIIQVYVTTQKRICMLGGYGDKWIWESYFPTFSIAIRELSSRINCKALKGIVADGF